MRAPGDAIGLLALECAMDESADALRLDPVELRLRNDTQIDPERARPFASRHLTEALREGAAPASAGPSATPSRPVTVTGGGLSVSASPPAIRGDVLQSATARARLESDGRLTVELAMTDIGTRYLHDPESNRCRDDGAAGRPGHRSSRRHPLSAHFWFRRFLRVGDIWFGGSCRLPEARPGLPFGITEAEGSVTPAALDAELCACRLRRALRRGRGRSGHGRGARAAHARGVRGRPYPQCENCALADDRRNDLGHRRCAGQENHIDLRYGSFVNQDLASYHVAVNADVGAMDVVFLDEDDPHGSPLGSKGIGELGICGAGAAVMQRHPQRDRRSHPRDFPATPDKLLTTFEMLDN